ncbi:hypothetical protein CEW46_26945 [Bacillus cereus]|nr:hypothetical protein CEW46_26945 [Bacillus cereus]
MADKELTNGNPKFELEYDVPIQSNEDIEKYNRELGTNFKSMEDHVLEMLVKVNDLVYDCAEQGGNYIGDGVKVKVVVEYDPEDK